MHIDGVGTRVAMVGALGALLVASCQVYDPDLLDGEPSPVPETCDSSREPPSRPAAPDDGVDAGNIVFGLKDMTLNQDGDRWRDIGFNLDGLCSDAPELVVECRPPSRSAQPEADGNEGIDNVFGKQLLPAVQIVIPDIEMESHESANMGLGAVVLDIRGWNGEPDDARVDVRLSITVGGTPVDPPDATEPPVGVDFDNEGVLTSTGERLPNPDWTGGDNWLWSREDMFLMGDVDRPFIRDDNAYVAGDVLVFKLPERSEIFFRGVTQSLTIRVTGGVATAEISEDRTRMYPVYFGGRWSIIDILETAEILGVCRGTTQYDIMSNLLDRVADVRSDPSSGGPDVTCDATSFGIRFTGYRGRFAGLGPVLPIGNACADMMTP